MIRILTGPPVDIVAAVVHDADHIQTVHIDRLQRADGLGKSLVEAVGGRRAQQVEIA